MAMLQGSRGLTPKRRLANKRVKPTAPKTPIPSPREVSNIPLPSTSLNWSQRLAPQCLTRRIGGIARGPGGGFGNSGSSECNKPNARIMIAPLATWVPQ
jgi:hypothetical protein